MTVDYEDYFAEIWIGLGTDLALLGVGEVRVVRRDDIQMVFFLNDLGIVTAQKIELFEFDGWEVFESFDKNIFRFEDFRDAQVQIKTIFLQWQAEKYSSVSAGI